MNKLYVPVGIPGCGKSTWARQLNNVIIVSTDQIRTDFPELNEKQVFNKFYETINTGLLSSDVVADATNISVASRARLLSHIINKDEIEIVCKVFTTPYDVCVNRLRKRNANNEQIFVPESACLSIMRRFQMPMLSEGFDEIIVDSTSDKSAFVTEQVASYNNWRHHDKWHGNETLSEHLGRIRAYLDENYTLDHLLSIFDDCYLEEVINYHDIGKLLTKKTKPDGYCNYLDHAEVSAYLYLTTYTKNDPKFFKTLYLINYHMLHFCPSEKIYALMSEKMIEQLDIFNLADTQGDR